jgi:hypothetical protein
MSPVCRHRKSPSCDGFNHWFIRAGCFFARCTKGIVHVRQAGRGRELYGTNFRHAVEFSRSGRTPSRPFRADQGQPELRYPVSSARSNTTGTARTPTDPQRPDDSARSLGASCLWESPPGATRPSPGGEVRLRSSVARTARTLVTPLPAAQISGSGTLSPVFSGISRARHRARPLLGAGLKSVTWGTPAVRRGARPGAFRRPGPGPPTRRWARRTASPALASRRCAPRRHRCPGVLRWC